MAVAVPSDHRGAAGSRGDGRRAGQSDFDEGLRRAMKIVVGILATALIAAALPATGAAAQSAPSTFTAGGLSPAGTVADDYWQAFARAVTEKSAGAIQPKLLTRVRLIGSPVKGSAGAGGPPPSVCAGGKIP